MEERKMVTEEQKMRAKLVNLPQFLMANGFDLKECSRGEYYWTEHDSLKIRDNEVGETGRWYRFSTNEGGDNIAFVQKYMNKDFVEAVEMLLNENLEIANRSYQPRNTYKAPEKPVEVRVEEDKNYDNALNYLTNVRGLDRNFIQPFINCGAIAQEKGTGNVLFKYYRYDNNQRKLAGVEKVGTKDKWKQVAKGSDATRGFELKRGIGEKAFFFESTIDMLSFAQMYNHQLNNCRLISMMGVKPNVVKFAMVRHSIKAENVYICTDNDEAGQKFYENLRREGKDYASINRIIPSENYKDWNDELRGITKDSLKKKEIIKNQYER